MAKEAGTKQNVDNPVENRVFLWISRFFTGDKPLINLHHDNKFLQSYQQLFVGSVDYLAFIF